jgi:hypothetical protein
MRVKNEACKNCLYDEAREGVLDICNQHKKKTVRFAFACVNFAPFVAKVAVNG